MDAETVDKAWECLRTVAEEALAEHVPEQPQRANKAWITEGTLELVEHRRALAGEGISRTPDNWIQ